METDINAYERQMGASAQGSLIVDPVTHKITSPSGKASVTTDVIIEVGEIASILSKHFQAIEQIGVAEQNTEYKVVYPKNEKKAQRMVYVVDDVAEKVYVGEMPPSDSPAACSIGNPICDPENKKRCICSGHSYNVLLATGGVMKYVLGGRNGQIRKVYGCVPNIEQTTVMNSYQYSTSKKELIQDLENTINANATTYLGLQGESCVPDLGSKVGAGTGVKIKSVIGNLIDQFISQETAVSQKITVEDRYGMCSPPYPFRCKKLKSDVIYPQNKGKCDCNALYDSKTRTEWDARVVSKCNKPEDCECYKCCQSNQRWIRQIITMESLAENIAKSSSEVIMKNKLTTKIDNSVRYTQDVPARIIMLSVCWNVAVVYILYYILKYVRIYFT